MGGRLTNVTGGSGDADAHPAGSVENDFGDSDSIYAFHADMRT